MKIDLKTVYEQIKYSIYSMYALLFKWIIGFLFIYL